MQTATGTVLLLSSSQALSGNLLSAWHKLYYRRSILTSGKYQQYLRCIRKHCGRGRELWRRSLLLALIFHFRRLSIGLAGRRGVVALFAAFYFRLTLFLVSLTRECAVVLVYLPLLFPRWSFTARVLSTHRLFCRHFYARVSARPSVRRCSATLSRDAHGLQSLFRGNASSIC